jgi:ribonuclease P protein component
MIAVGRLRRRAEFLKVAAGRRKWATPGLIMQVRSWDESERRSLPSDMLRIGYTASRKVGSSVARNRARRRLRAAARETLPRIGCPAHDYVLIARTGTLTRAYPALLGDIATALERLAARCGDGRPAPAMRGAGA